MNSPLLFRAEVLHWQAERSAGVPLRNRTSGFPAWSFLLCCLFVLVLWAVLRVPINRTVMVRGHLTLSQGPLKVLSPSSGTVSQLFVFEGESVHEGQQLAVIRHDLFDSGGETALAAGLQHVQDELRRLQRRQDLREHEFALQRHALKSRQQAEEASLALMRAQLRFLSQRVDLGQRELTRQTIMHGRGLLAQGDLDRAQGQLYQLEQNRIALQGGILDSEEALRGVGRELELLPVQKERDLLELAGQRAVLQERERELSRHSKFSLMAPADGVINNLLYSHGEQVNERAPFLDILPGNSQLEARLYVPSRAMGELAPGQTVLLAIDAYPFRRYGHFSARIQRVADTVVDPREHLFILDVREPVYLAHAELQQENPAAFSLRAGMVFTAYVVTGKESLMARLYAPLRSLGGRLWR